MDDKDSLLKSTLSSGWRIGKKIVRFSLAAGFVTGVAFSMINPWTDWVYRVDTNKGVVITEADGERVAVTEEGWHSRVPFLSTHEGIYQLANQEVFWEGNSTPHKVITKDGKVIMASASTFFSITDLEQYAVENIKEASSKTSVTPKRMIQDTLDSIISGHIQKTESAILIHNRGEVEKAILEKLNASNISPQYGITINAFHLTYTNYIDSVVVADGERQALAVRAEGRKDAAIKDREAIETLARADVFHYKIFEKALNPETPEEKRSALKLFEALVRYRTLKDRPGDTIWIVPEGNSPIPTYNPGKNE